MSQIKLAIFDMDGTLLDTMQDLHNCVCYITNKFHFPERTYDETRRAVGTGLYNLVKKSCPPTLTEAELQVVLDEYIPYYDKNSTLLTQPYEGLTEVLKEMKQSGIKLACVTNKRHVIAKELTERFFPGMFDVVIGEMEGLARKPEPDGCLAVMNQLGIARENTVYIGDSEVDVMTAKNTNVSGIAVLWGFRTEEELTEAGANVFAKTPSELIHVIESL